jgi:hypothetical protein
MVSVPLTFRKVKINHKLLQPRSQIPKRKARRLNPKARRVKKS